MSMLCTTCGSALEHAQYPDPNGYAVARYKLVCRQCEARASNERACFERYILTERGSDYLERNDPAIDAEHDYADYFVQEAWEAWQARAAVETAAVPHALEARVFAHMLDSMEEGKPYRISRIHDEITLEPETN